MPARQCRLRHKLQGRITYAVDAVCIHVSVNGDGLSEQSVCLSECAWRFQVSLSDLSPDKLLRLLALGLICVRCSCRPGLELRLLRSELLVQRELNLQPPQPE